MPANLAAQIRVVKFCSYGITFAEILFCTCLETSIKETINIVKSTWKGSKIMKKVIIGIACCALVAPLAFAKDIKGKELKRARPWRVAFLAETPANVTVTAPSPNQRVEGASVASYSPTRTIVVRQDGPGTYILEARGHVFNSRGEMVEGPISPGTRMHVYFIKDDAGTQTVDRVVID